MSRAFLVDPVRRRSGLATIREPARRCAHDVILDVLEVGICGTDREIVEFAFGEPPTGEDRLVLGHECLARVVGPAPDGTGLQDEQLAVPIVRDPCEAADCAPCRHDDQDFCLTGQFAEHGIRRAHGFLAERIVMPAARLVAVPDALRATAVLAEPLTVAEKVLRQLAAVAGRVPSTGAARPGAALVVGAGPIGLLAAMALVLRGWTVTVGARSVAPTPNARFAEALGARYVSTHELPLGVLAAETGGFELVLEAAGDATVALEATAGLRPNGILALTGLSLPGPPRAGFDLGEVIRRVVLGNQVLLGSVNAARADFEAAIADLLRAEERWPGLAEQLITSRYPLERSADAIHTSGGIKAVIEVQEAQAA